MVLIKHTVLFLLLDCCIWVSCFGEQDLQNNEVCYSEDCRKTAKRILDAMDPSVSPCQDFYRFTCGRYLETAVIPPDSEKVSSFTETTDVLRDKVKRVVFEKIRSNDPRPYRLLKKFMKLCMDEDRMDTIGIEPALRRLEKAGGWPVLGGWKGKRWDLVNTLATLDKVAISGANSLFDIKVFSDYKNSTRALIQIDETKPGLERKFLIAGVDDTRVKAYFDFMVTVAVIFGAKKQEARRQLKRSLLFEIELAKLMRPNEEKRNIEVFYNPFTLRQLTSQMRWLDWRRLLNMVLPRNVLPLREDETIILSNPEYLSGVGRLVNKYSPRTVANYVMWRAAFSYSRHLTKELRNRRVKLDKETRGIAVRKPRWTECIQQADKSLEHVMGSIYVKTFFDGRSRKVARKMMSVIQDEMRRLLEENDWMDRRTRKRALEKVARMHHHIGYPDELLDMDQLDGLYTSVNLKRTDDFLSAVVQLEVLKRKRDLSLLRIPVNKTDWRRHSNVNQINAFYNAFENSVSIPAGILQYPFFGKDLPIYVNLGKIGIVMGHEITHGFDDQGSQVNQYGNLRKWWDKESTEHFQEKTRCMVDQFSRLRDNVTQMNINGVVVQGEVVADQGAMKLAYRAWERLGRPGPLLPGLQGFTRDQVMMMSLGNIWCEKKTLESRRHQVLTAPHPVSDIRVNGIAINFDHFQEIFNCRSSDPMVAISRCVVW